MEGISCASCAKLRRHISANNFSADAALLDELVEQKIAKMEASTGTEEDLLCYTGRNQLWGGQSN
jgi:hypothetical protein